MYDTLRREDGTLRERPDARSTEVVLRNHDLSHGYAVTVELVACEGPSTPVTETYGLAAGEIRCPETVAPRGPTRVTARLADGTVDATVGRMSTDPEETALVEVGNGLVSVTHGL